MASVEIALVCGLKVRVGCQDRLCVNSDAGCQDRLCVNSGAGATLA